MSKGSLIDALAHRTGSTKKLAGDVLEGLVDIITDQLQNGESVTITGFGTFLVSERKARTGVNPQKPEQKIKIPATTVPRFKAGKNLKDAVKK
ncbi:HU family DNA-binding protein [Candidatus Peribacteria bacterium]|nr:HU family DNA-binding protein [Candidatus Peribacteria bacterium]